MDSVGNIILYFIIALAIIVFSVLAVTTRKILRAATYLLFVLFATAFVYFQLDFEFLGAVQIAVYAGGILVLFVFAIMLTHKPGKESEPLSSEKRALGLSAADYSIEQIGKALLNSDKFGLLLPFEAVSVLLLACIIGGVVVARRR